MKQDVDRSSVFIRGKMTLPLARCRQNGGFSGRNIADHSVIAISPSPVLQEVRWLYATSRHRYCALTTVKQAARAFAGPTTTRYASRSGSGEGRSFNRNRMRLTHADPILSARVRATARSLLLSPTDSRQLSLCLVTSPKQLFTRYPNVLGSACPGSARGSRTISPAQSGQDQEAVSG